MIMKSNPGTRSRGVAQVLASGIGFGTLGYFGKAAYAIGFAPGELLSLRFAISSLLLGTALVISRPRALRISRRGLLSCLTLGVFGYALFASCYFEALKGLSASLAALLLYAYPVLVSLGGYFIFGERVGRRDWLALPLVLAGLLFLIFGDPMGGDPMADLTINRPLMISFGLASALFYALYILGSRKLLTHHDALGTAFYIQLFAALALAPLHLRAPGHIWALVAQGWVPLLGLAALSTALPITLFLAGLQKLSSTEASILSASEPVSAVLVASIALGERFSLEQLLGGAIVLCAMILVSIRSKNSTSPL
jgi:drug/metabolite transporter (DMT)-like permease